MDVASCLTKQTARLSASAGLVTTSSDRFIESSRFDFMVNVNVCAHRWVQMVAHKNKQLNSKHYELKISCSV